MNCCSVKLCLVSLLSALAAQMCGCSSDIQRRRSSERTHLALPTVTCSEKGMRAAFGPLVKDNLRVRGRTTVFQPKKESVKQFLVFLFHNTHCNTGWCPVLQTLLVPYILCLVQMDPVEWSWGTTKASRFLADMTAAMLVWRYLHFYTSYLNKMSSVNFLWHWQCCTKNAVCFSDYSKLWKLSKNKND